MIVYEKVPLVLLPEANGVAPEGIVELVTLCVIPPEFQVQTIMSPTIALKVDGVKALFVTETLIVVAFVCILCRKKVKTQISK